MCVGVRVRTAETVGQSEVSGRKGEMGSTVEK